MNDRKTSQQTLKRIRHHPLRPPPFVKASVRNFGVQGLYDETAKKSIANARFLRTAWLAGLRRFET
jgi:hypothetical protein